DLTDRGTVDKALLGHLCRCTGWLPIREAAALVAQGATQPDDRDVAAASRRAELEGGAPQRVGPSVAIGRSGFADDLASRDSLVALPSGDSWIVAESISEARAAMGKVQGRRSSVVPTPPIELPAGPWAAALQTCWTEPAYLEPDAVYCEPGGVPVGPLTNGGAFGAKVDDHLRAVAAELATQHGRPVRVLYDREDVVRRGAKRPPLALGLRPDMSGVLRVAATPGVEGLVAAIAPGVVVEPVEVSGPPTSTQIRGAIRAELEMAMAAIRDDHEVTVTLDSGAWCRAAVDSDGVHLVVSAGAPLDPVVLRSYTIGAAHQALGFVGSEALAVDSQGEVQDLTIRSFGVLRAVDTPPIHVDIVNSDAAPVAVGEAVFCAVASAAWAQAGRPQAIPVSAAT
ncbi:MAG: molybdopterin-dependent oxidoreductase, partial [Acidimicrobiales bacterium]|nr:molybdopterin-dependent oxidoreductase [Acidimicrobiales bacterium]